VYAGACADPAVWCVLPVYTLQAIERSKGGAPQHGSDDSDPSSLLGSELGENHGWEVSLLRCNTPSSASDVFR
jgi:hypothetical protein